VISIIIPVYNAAPTLGETIDSALSSGVINQQIVIVDDGSTDNSAEIISSYRDRDPAIESWTLDSNQGGGAARNFGISKAKHSYIFVLDSDDILIPGILPKALAELKDYDSDGIATSQSVFFTDDIGRPVRQIAFEMDEGRFEMLISATPNPFIGNLLFKKSLFERIGGYPRHHGFDTQGFGFRMLGNLAKIRVSKYQLYFQRLPKTPSYYIRESRSGNSNKNWFYILFEFLYKFNEETRELILSYDYTNARQIAMGRNIFSELVSMGPNIYCPVGMGLDKQTAIALYHSSDDELLSLWASIERHRWKFEAKAALDSKSVRNDVVLFRHFVGGMSGSLTMATSLMREDFNYFFSGRSLLWKLMLITQRIRNRINRCLRRK